MIHNPYYYEPWSWVIWILFHAPPVGFWKWKGNNPLFLWTTDGIWIMHLQHICSLSSSLSPFFSALCHCFAKSKEWIVRAECRWGRALNFLQKFPFFNDWNCWGFISSSWVMPSFPIISLRFEAVLYPSNQSHKWFQQIAIIHLSMCFFLEERSKNFFSTGSNHLLMLWR